MWRTTAFETVGRSPALARDAALGAQRTHIKKYEKGRGSRRALDRTVWMDFSS